MEAGLSKLVLAT